MVGHMCKTIGDGKVVRAGKQKKGEKQWKPRDDSFQTTGPSTNNVNVVQTQGMGPNGKIGTVGT